jgi:hypothetical protein
LSKAALVSDANVRLSKVQQFRLQATPINNRRRRGGFVTGNFHGWAITITIEQIRTVPGSIDVLSARVEGDPYLASDGLSDEGQSATE